MAVPVAQIVATVGKKLAVDMLTEPEKIVKNVIIGLGGILAIILIFALPIIFIISLPVLVLNAGTSNSIDNLAKQKLALYQNAPITVNADITAWINQKKAEFSKCDDKVVHYDFNLNWQSLIAIDAVRNNQDFNNVSADSINSLANRFLVKEAHTEQYQVQETYTESEPYTVTANVTDQYGKTTQKQVTSYRSVTKTRTVTKTRGVINVSSKPLAQVANELGFSPDLAQVANNMYSNLMGIDMEGNLNIYDVDVKDLKQYPPGSANIPYFNQTDSRWGNYSYGQTGTIRSGGCGPTSLSMVVAGLTHRIDINPKTIADWSVANGHRAEGAGSYWSLMTDGGAHYGLSVTPISRSDPKSIVSELSKGHPVIAAMGPGHFTSGGHFIVLRGVTSDGKILVNDPISVSRSDMAWDISIIINESSTNGGDNGSPFWTFSN